MRRVRLLTNNTEKVDDLEAHGVHVDERAPLVVGTGPDNIGYLAVKRDRMGHVLPGVLPGGAPARRGDDGPGRTA